MSVPILLVTGFLGAGKTTFINGVLQADHGLRIAAIVNDFGSINIDARLLESATDEVIGLKNGCICCSLQGDLLRTLKRVMGEAERPELIVIEASGVADPKGIVDALMDPVLWRSARLDGVVCLVDAEDVTADPGRLDDPLWKAQVAAADVVQLSKTGALRADQVTALTDRLAALGRHRVLGADGSARDFAALLGFAAAPSPGDGRARVEAADRFEMLEWRSEGAVPMAGFQALIQALSPALLRAKGFVAFREKPGQQFVFQLVGRRATLAPADTAGQGCELVLIGERGKLHVPAIRAALDELGR
ncbi:cobalamin biosynthesis protein CobW [Thalassobaculum fulvum]|uniref:Cobalamin biosynthesis protein CobW n=1 Tax=Thalassobaculum fulvum TaxID=1633335 RepID=A0A918XXF6_9PROT|nr:GTP-binding protein [Thalassobaculum fulvum]GHD62658.1 cobalamin biosynthesis protein CobW [Thalassobaculum fulvum]